MNPCTDPPFEHQPARIRAGKSRSGSARERRPSPPDFPDRAPTGGKSRPRLGSQPVIPTLRQATDPTPTSSGKANCVRRPSGSSHPGGALQPALLVGSRCSGPLAGSLRSSMTPGKIPLCQESARPALITRRQAGACTWERTPRQTHTDTGTHAGGTRRACACGSAPGPVPGWGGPGRVRREGHLLRPSCLTGVRDDTRAGLAAPPSGRRVGDGARSSSREHGALA